MPVTRPEATRAADSVKTLVPTTVPVAIMEVFSTPPETTSYSNMGIMFVGGGTGGPEGGVMLGTRPRVLTAEWLTPSFFIFFIATLGVEPIDRPTDAQKAARAADILGALVRVDVTPGTLERGR